MIKSRELLAISKTMDALSRAFPQSTLCYSYCNLSEMHTIDVTGPDVEQMGDEQWAELYLKHIDWFESRFPKHSLLIVRDGILCRVSVDEAIRVIRPQTYIVGREA